MGELEWLADPDRPRPLATRRSSFPASESDFFWYFPSTGTSRSSRPPTSSQLQKERSEASVSFKVSERESKRGGGNEDEPHHTRPFVRPRHVDSQQSSNLRLRRRGRPPRQIRARRSVLVLRRVLLDLGLVRLSSSRSRGRCRLGLNDSGSKLLLRWKRSCKRFEPEGEEVSKSRVPDRNAFLTLSFLLSLPSILMHERNRLHLLLPRSHPPNRSMTPLARRPSQHLSSRHTRRETRRAVASLSSSSCERSKRPSSSVTLIRRWEDRDRSRTGCGSFRELTLTGRRDGRSVE